VPDVMGGGALRVYSASQRARGEKHESTRREKQKGRSGGISAWPNPEGKRGETDPNHFQGGKSGQVEGESPLPKAEER